MPQIADILLMSLFMLFFFGIDATGALPMARGEAMQICIEDPQKSSGAGQQLSRRAKRKKQKRNKKKPSPSPRLPLEIDDPTFELPKRYAMPKGRRSKAPPKIHHKGAFKDCDPLCQRFEKYRLLTLNEDGGEEQQVISSLSLKDLPRNSGKTVWTAHTKPFAHQVRLPKTLDPTVNEKTNRIELTRLEKLLLVAAQVRHARLFCFSHEWFDPGILQPILTAMASADQLDTFKRLGNAGYTDWTTVASQKAQHAFRVHLARKAIAYFAGGKSEKCKTRDHRFEGEPNDVHEHFNSHINRSQRFFTRLAVLEILDRLLPKRSKNEIVTLEFSFMSLQHEGYSEKVMDAWKTACITYFRYRIENHIRHVAIIAKDDVDKSSKALSQLQPKISLKVQDLSQWYLAWLAVRRLLPTDKHEVQWFLDSKDAIKRMQIIMHPDMPLGEELKQQPDIDASKHESKHEQVQEAQESEKRKNRRKKRRAGRTRAKA